MYKARKIKIKIKWLCLRVLLSCRKCLGAVRAMYGTCMLCALAERFKAMTLCSGPILLPRRRETPYPLGQPRHVGRRRPIWRCNVARLQMRARAERRVRSVLRNMSISRRQPTPWPRRPLATTATPQVVYW